MMELCLIFSIISIRTSGLVSKVIIHFDLLLLFYLLGERVSGRKVKREQRGFCGECVYEREKERESFH